MSPSRMLLPLLIAALAAPVAAEDWPAFRGANRQGKSPETGLLKSWPEDGPKELWSVDGVGDGYSSPTVATTAAGLRVFVTGMIDGTGHLFAFDGAGKQLWKIAYGPETKGAGYPFFRMPPFDCAI